MSRSHLSSRFGRCGLAAAAIAAVCFGSRTAVAATPAPYEINTMLSLTGPASFVSKSVQQSLDAIQKWANANGGIQGRPIKFIYYDDQGSPQIAVQIANQIMAKHAPVILGLALTATCQTVMPMVAAAGPVIYCFTPAVHPTRGSFSFSSSVSSDDQVQGYLNYFRGRHWKRIALITTIDATGQSLERSWTRYLSLPQNTDLQLVAQEHFNVSDLSVGAQIERIKTANPDVLMTGTSGTPFGTILHGLRDTGATFPVASSFANLSYAEMGQFKTYLPRELLFGGVRAISPSQSAAGPVRDAQKIYATSLAAMGLRPDAGTDLGWDPTMVMIDALRSLGTGATAEQVRDHIDGLHGWVGINGVYDFGDAEQRGISVNGFVVDRWDPQRATFVAVSKPGGAPL